MRARTAEERVALALRLGARDLAIYAAARGIDLAEARRRLRQETQRARRRPSAAAL